MKCKAYHNFGHYVTVEGSVCYTLVNAQLCSQFLSDPRHAASIKRNTLFFQQNQKDKYIKLKTVTKIGGYMRTLRDDGHSENQLKPLVNLCLALESESDQASCSSADTTSVSE